MSRNVPSGQERGIFLSCPPPPPLRTTVIEKGKSFIDFWEDCWIDSWGNWVPEEYLSDYYCAFGCHSGESNLYFLIPVPVCAPLYYAAWCQRLPKSRKNSVPLVEWQTGSVPEEGGSCGQAEGSSGTPPPIGTRGCWFAASMPESAEAAHRSPLPNIYDEAGWGTLSLGMPFGFHSGRQVGFISQKLLWSQFLPETICFV